MVSTFLHILGEARVFILATLSATGMSDSNGVAEEPDERIAVVRLAPLERGEPDDLLESHDVAGLPAVLADALTAHIRDGSIDLDSVASWLRAERSRARQISDESSPPIGQRAMRRVEPDTTWRRRRLGTP